MNSAGFREQPSLVLLWANPLDDIRNTTGIVTVVAAGRFYDSGAIAKVLQEGIVRAR